ncbi:carbohydrate-binding module family 48 protein [Lophiostoma macrostomum CBS 122681]|uniref:Carbohydrate-binding module family 48 protein n=1 Tax=Lophiostoma macrostomum CBS 122681 TaxID=1314788 RepID=A0A6A6T9A1_9PLEO|nr:carbohydrate-binding module family 48 protein [Lophiostoma macrostomum CBS 122681]
MGKYTFTWEHPAKEVTVTGDFDDWKQTVTLVKEDGIFKKTVELPKAKHQYKFVVDGNWVLNDTHPKEDDGKGIWNNILQPNDIKDEVSTLSSAAPESTTAALAGAVPKEETAKSTDSLPGAFPMTPAAETPGSEPQAFSVNPIPATEGAGNPVKLAPGEKVPDPSTFTSNTINSTVKEDQDEAEPEETVSVAPIPATAGAGNPIHLAPGEKVPDPSTLTSNTISSTARTDAASYEKSDSQPPQLGPVVLTPEAEREAKGGMFSLPPLAGNLIPESSLPQDTNAETEKDPGVTIQSAAPTSTTAALAGEVPKEPRGVPETVTESQKEAAFPPEASANAEAVEEKKELEQELLEKVPKEPPAAESSTTAKVGEAAAAGTAVAAGAATYLSYRAQDAKDKAAETVGLNGQATTTSEVPEVVTESQKEADVSPEASANKEAVEEKKEVEAELLKEVKKSTESGEPAPTVTAATSDTAPGLSEDALVDTKPLKSSSEPDALNADAKKPALPEPSQPAAIDSRDVSPMSKQPTTTEPTVTTGAESSKVETTTAPQTPQKDAPSSAKATPESVASSSAADKKKKRTSIFGKLKAKFKN